MSLITSIGTAVPAYRTPQNRIVDFMCDAYADSPTAARKIHFLHEHSGIEARHSALPDFSAEPAARSFFPVPHMNGTAPHVGDRMEAFVTLALPLALKAVARAFARQPVAEVTHLITVSCTGLAAPGLDVTLVEALGLPDDTYHTAVNFLGCNAAFHALRQADLICRAEPEAVVLVVCVELCTLHFQPAEGTDHLLANTIFADGAAALRVTSPARARRQGCAGLRVEGFSSRLAHEGKAEMGWYVTPGGFVMALTARVPVVLRQRCGEMVARALEKLGLTRDDVHNWAVHPGGKKILEATGASLQLHDADLAASREVLRDYGNMSSPTILFVLERLLSGGAARTGRTFALGFGPGLSMEAAVFAYQHPNG